MCVCACACAILVLTARATPVESADERMDNDKLLAKRCYCAYDDGLDSDDDDDDDDDCG